MSQKPDAPEPAEDAVEKILTHLSQLYRIAYDGARKADAVSERLVTGWREDELPFLARRLLILKQHEASAIVARGDAGRAGVVFAKQPANSALSWLIQACKRVKAFMHNADRPGHWNEVVYSKLTNALNLDTKTVEEIAAEANYELAKKCVLNEEHPENALATPKARMHVDEANKIAMDLAKKMRKAFFAWSEREQARRIGCSWATWTKTPFYQQAKKKGPAGKPKKPSSPKIESLTTEREAVTGEGDRDEVLKQLAAEQAADKEPSPLDNDPPNRPRKIHSRKRL